MTVIAVSDHESGATGRQPSDVGTRTATPGGWVAPKPLPRMVSLSPPQAPDWVIAVMPSFHVTRPVGTGGRLALRRPSSRRSCRKQRISLSSQGSMWFTIPSHHGYTWSQMSGSQRGGLRRRSSSSSTIGSMPPLGKPGRPGGPGMSGRSGMPGIDPDIVDIGCGVPTQVRRPRSAWCSSRETRPS